MCGCQAHYDTNAMCTCSCPEHENRVKAERVEVVQPYDGPRFILEITVTDRERQARPMPELKEGDLTAYIAEMNLRRTAPEYSLRAEVSDGTSLRQLLEAAAKNVEDF